MTLSASVFSEVGSGSRVQRSARGAEFRGMALISVLMQRNSASTVVRARHKMFTTHQEIVCGTRPIYTVQDTRWIKYMVAAKSKHCFVLCTMYHIPKALAKEKKNK